MNKEILETRWGEFDSLEDFGQHPLQDGRFSLRIDQGRFECFYLGAEAPSRLFVLLSGARDPERSSLPKFDRWSWRAKFPGPMLCISDPTLYLDEQNMRIGWYIGSKEHDWMGSMARFVRAFAARLGLSTDRVISYGSSAGGFGSLLLTARLGNATAVAINPQTNALEYFEKEVTRLITVGFGVESAQALPAESQARFSAMEAIRSAPEARFMVVQNLLDRHHYRKHYLPWCEASGAPRRGGLSRDGRFRTVVYEAPGGHGPEPRDMVEVIVNQAIDLSERGAKRSARRSAPVLGTKQIGPIASSQIYLLQSPGYKDIEPERLTFRPPGRQDVAPYAIEFPLDWDVDPYHDRNWCGQLHMWRMMDAYLLRYEQKRETQWLEMPLRIMDDWHRFHLKEKKKSRYSWLDMMAGLRAMKLAYLLSLHRSGILPLCQERQDNYLGLVQAHLDFLLNPDNVAYSNHTFFDVHGAMALAQLVEGPEQKRIKDFVGEVIPKLIRSQFNEYGLHLEHSPEYHPFGIKCLQRLQDSKWFGEYGIDATLAKAVAMENWLKLPDGRMAPIGDSNGAPPPPPSTPTVFRGRNQILHNDGYVIMRDDGGRTTSGDASYLFFMGAFHSRFHKQPDDLSFIWFEGEDILCDAGKYAYKSDANRDYVLSTRAHNTVEIDGKSYWDGIAKDPALLYGSAIESVSVHDWGHLVCARVNQPRFSVQHYRFLLYCPGQWVLVVDRLAGQDDHQYTQWFHFAPHIRIRSLQPGAYDGTLGSGRKLSVRNECSKTMTPELVRGQLKPRMQGWISQRYREIEENDALGFSSNGNDVVFATLLTLDDQGSSIKMMDERKLSIVVKTRSDTEKLILSIGERTCRVRKT